MPPLTDLNNFGDTAKSSGDQSLSYLTQEPNTDDTADGDPVVILPDLPPESFWVAASDELDWLDRNTFIQCHGSVKFEIPKSFDPNSMPSHRSLSFNNKKPKSSIIGPPKSQKFNQAGNAKQQLVEIRKLFRSRSESGKDRVLQVPKPGSPRLSCMGRVGSKTKCTRNRIGFWATVRAKFVNWDQRKQPII